MNKNNQESSKGGDGYPQELRELGEASLVLSSFKHREFDEETLSTLERMKSKFLGHPKAGQRSSSSRTSYKRPRSGSSRAHKKLVKPKNYPPQVPGIHQVNRINPSFGGAKDGSKTNTKGVAPELPDGKPRDLALKRRGTS